MNPNDPHLSRDDFESCFAGEPPAASAADDLARGRHRLGRRRRMAGGAVAGVVAAAVLAVPLLTSQTFAPGPADPAGTPTAQPTSMRTRAVTGCSSGTFKIAEAIKDPAQRPVDDVTRLPAVEDGKRVLLHAVAANGERLIEIGRDELVPGGLSDLAIEDPATGRRTTIRGADQGPETPGRGSGLSGSALDQGFAAWIETTDSGWAIRAFNRSTGKISTVVDSTAPSDRAYDLAPDNYPTQVTLWKGTLAWVETLTVPGRPDHLQVNVYQRDLGGDEVTRLAKENALDPVLTDGWLYYRSYDEQSAGSAIERRSLDGGQVEPVHADAAQPARELSAFGDVAAWIEEDAVVVHRGSTRIARVVAPEGQTVDSVQVGAEAVTITTGADRGQLEFLLDLRPGCRLHQLDGPYADGRTLLTGRTVAWSVDDPESDRPGWAIGRLR